MNPLTIIKATGETDHWDPRKLERSLRSAGAPEETVRDIVASVEASLFDGMRTTDIYRHAFDLLKKHDRPMAAQYSLKRALLELGPSGYPFEQYLGRLFAALGYTTKVGVMVRGKCVEHEVDVVAENDEERIFVEAKFHNSLGVKTDVKVALYVHARFKDIEAAYRAAGDTKPLRPWLISNTLLSNQAIAYGTCAGLTMTAWNHPRGKTIQELVQETQMHPVTCLTTLSTIQKTRLIEEGVVLCRDILAAPHSLDQSGLPRAKTNAILAEAVGVCGPGTKTNVLL